MNLQKLSELDDQELIDLFHHGHRTAMDTLFLRYKNKIYSFIYRKVKDVHLAEDIFQTTFLKVLESFEKETYVESGKFTAWVKHIAHNLCIDAFRKMRRSKCIRLSEEYIDYYQQSDELIADEKIIRKERHERVQKLLLKLSEEKQEVVLLRHYADLPFKEIAKLINCNINTTHGYMRYALANLRKLNQKVA